MAAPQLADFVLETANAPGTGVITLIGPVEARRSFAAAFPKGGSVFYFADDGAQSEWGIGTLDVTGPVTLTRSVIKGNTAGTTVPLNFTGTVRVYSEVPAESLPLVDEDGLVTAGGKILADRDWMTQNFVGQRNGAVRSDLFVAPRNSTDTLSPNIGAGLLTGEALTARAWLTVNGAGSAPSGRLRFTDGTSSVDLEILSIVTRGWGQQRLPIGTILMWYGAQADVPAGWSVCNGSNGTPDMRGQLPMGASSDDEKGSKTGQKTWSGKTGDHTLTVDEIPSHTHRYSYRRWSDSGRDTAHNIVSDAASAAGSFDTSDTGGGQAHSHDIPEIDLTPPSVRVWFIMRTSYPDNDTTTGGGSNGGGDSGSAAAAGTMAANLTTFIRNYSNDSLS